MRLLFRFVFLSTIYFSSAFSQIEKINFVENKSSLFEPTSANVMHNSSVKNNIGTYLDLAAIKKNKKDTIPFDSNLNSEKKLRKIIIPNKLDKSEEPINTYSKSKEVSSKWKHITLESFNKDLNVIKEVVLDAEKNGSIKDKFLQRFKKQKDSFNKAISKTRSIDDASYKKIRGKKFFIGRIANAQKRSNILLTNSTNSFRLTSSMKKKIRLNILADINSYILEELKQGLKYSKDFYLSDKIIQDIVNKNLNRFKGKGNFETKISNKILSNINTVIANLITKKEYQPIATELRNNISSEFKDLPIMIEQILNRQLYKISGEIKKKYDDLLSSLVSKISLTETKFQVYMEKTMQNFDQKLDLLLSKKTNKTSSIDLDLFENKIKDYFNSKLEDIEGKIEAINKSDRSSYNQKVKTIFNISKKNIDKKIYDEVGKQLSALKEDRIRKFEKLSRRKDKDERRRVLRELLEKELRGKIN